MRFPKSSDANSFSKAATMGTGSIVSLLEVDENEPAAVSVELLVVEDNVVVFTASFLRTIFSSPTSPFGSFG